MTSSLRDLFPHLRHIDRLWITYLITRKDYPYLTPRYVTDREGGAVVEQTVRIIK